MNRIILPDNRASMPALSVRQPWAWLIVNGYKPIENRTWKTPFRGEMLIHAGKKMTVGDYDSALLFIEAFVDVNIIPYVPSMEKLERGGVVGMARLTDCVQTHESPWMTGNDDPDAYGFLMADAKPLPFIPWTGRLGFFDVVVRP